MQQATVRRYISIGILLLLMAFFAFTSEYFISSRNLFAILRDASVIGIVAIGVTFVIITAGIDLSTGSIIAFVAMTMANYFRYTLLPIWLMILVGLVVGIAAGAFNGFIITRFKLPEFIATLSTMGIFRSLTYIIAVKDELGMITSQSMNDPNFIALGDSIGDLSIVSIVFIILVVAGQLLLKNTRFGTYVYATGTNSKAARLAGINTDRVRFLCYLLTGACCAIGAVFICARLQSTTAVIGVGFEFSVIAAVVVGGCALSGGRGDIVGSAIGALFMATLENGIYKYQINTATQQIIKGLIIIAIVVFDAWYIKRFAAKQSGERKAGAAK